MLRSKYLIWCTSLIVFVLGWLFDYTEPQGDTMLPLSYFTGIISIILFVMGFIYFFLRKMKLGKGSPQQVMIDVCVVYSVFFALFFPLAAFSKRIFNYNIGDFIGNCAFTFILIQVIALIVFIIELFRLLKNKLL